MKPGTYTIAVTREDIANGFPQDCFKCPIALAMERAGFQNVEVENFTAFYNTADGLRDLSDLPPRARNFIARYDKGKAKNPRPFSFPLTVADR